MFRWLKSKYKEKVETTLNNLEYRLDTHKNHFHKLEEEIVILRKLANLKEYKTLETYSNKFISNHGDYDYRTEESRKKLREEGFDFCHKKEDGNEIWAKY